MFKENVDYSPEVSGYLAINYYKISIIIDI